MTLAAGQIHVLASGREFLHEIVSCVKDYSRAARRNDRPEAAVTLWKPVTLAPASANRLRTLRRKLHSNISSPLRLGSLPVSMASGPRHCPAEGRNRPRTGPASHWLLHNRHPPSRPR